MNDDDPDWYLKQWIAALGTSQAQLVEETGFGKSKVSELVNGKWHYTRAIVNAMAKALKIEPWELLMHPDHAMSMRRLQDNALRIAAESRMPFRSEAEGR